MKKKFTVAVAMAAAVALVATACGTPKEEDVFTGEKADVPKWQAHLDCISPKVYSDVSELELEPGTYISVIGKQAGTAYWEQVKAGVKQAAADINEHLGYKGEDKIKVLYNAPSDGENIDEQVNILDEELSRYPDVIAISSIDENASAVQFDLAAENGIPIVAFDSQNSYMGIQCTCMTDNVAAAKTGAVKLAEKIGGSGEIVLLAQDSVSGTAKARTEAFRSELETNYPDIQIVETIYMDQMDRLKRQVAAESLGVSQEQMEAWILEASGAEKSDGDEVGDQTADLESVVAEDESLSEEARTRLEEIFAKANKLTAEEAVAQKLEKYPNLKGCFAVNADSLSLGVKAIDALSTESDCVLMGFDAGKSQVSALKAGKIDGIVVQNPFGIGYSTVVAAARTVLQIGNEAFVDTGYTWVDQENLETDSVKGMLYE